MEKVNPRELIDKNPIFESLFAPLYYKARETGRNDSIINDPLSVEVLNKIDYDFSYFDKNTSGQFVVSVRTRILDEQASRYLAEHSNVVIINLGAGLDTRFQRMKSANLKHWYDIDLPEVIKFREKIFNNSDKNSSIGKSVLDSSWCDDINIDDDSSCLFIAEGLFMYFEESEVIHIIEMIKSNFPKASILCEIFHKKLINYNVKNAKNNKDLTFKWGIESSPHIEKMTSGVKVVNEWNMFDYHRDRQNLITKILCLISNKFKGLVKIVELKCQVVQASTR